MELRELLTNHNLDHSQFKQKFNNLVSTHPHYAHLDDHNRDLMTDVILKFRDRIRSGVGVSEAAVKEQMYGLYQHRHQLGLSEYDLKEIHESLESLKK